MKSSDDCTEIMILVPKAEATIFDWKKYVQNPPQDTEYVPECGFQLMKGQDTLTLKRLVQLSLVKRN